MGQNLKTTEEKPFLTSFFLEKRGGGEGFVLVSPIFPLLLKFYVNQFLRTEVGRTVYLSKNLFKTLTTIKNIQLTYLDIYIKLWVE